MPAHGRVAAALAAERDGDVAQGNGQGRSSVIERRSRACRRRFRYRRHRAGKGPGTRADARRSDWSIADPRLGPRESDAKLRPDRKAPEPAKPAAVQVERNQETRDGQRQDERATTRAESKGHLDRKSPRLRRLDEDEPGPRLARTTTRLPTPSRTASRNARPLSPAETGPRCPAFRRPDRRGGRSVPALVHQRLLP